MNRVPTLTQRQSHRPSMEGTTWDWRPGTSLNELDVFIFEDLCPFVYRNSKSKKNNTFELFQLLFGYCRDGEVG